MKKILILFGFIYSVHVSGQDYKHYYEGINNAKTAIIVDSLENAVSYYHSTFEKFDFVFARDCYNALEVSSKLNNNEMTDYFVRRSIKQGIEFDILEIDSLIFNFRKSEYWPGIILAKDSLRECYNTNVNWEIRSEIIEMFTEDQSIRDVTDKNRFNLFRIRKLSKEFEEVDRKCILRIMEITKEYGFPGEKLIGIDVESMHPKVSSERLTAGMPIVIFIHHYSQPNESYNPLLFNEINTGSLSNEHFAIISDFQFTYGKEKFGKIPCFSRRFGPKETIENINEHRREIGLMEIETIRSLERTKVLTPFWKWLY